MTTLTTRRFDSRGALDTELEARLAQAIADAGPRAIMLSGGHTPLPAYRALASRTPRHDERLHVLFSDERYVPTDSAGSAPTVTRRRSFPPTTSRAHAGISRSRYSARMGCPP